MSYNNNITSSSSFGAWHDVFYLLPNNVIETTIIFIYDCLFNKEMGALIVELCCVVFSYVVLWCEDFLDIIIIIM